MGFFARTKEEGRENRPGYLPSHKRILHQLITLENSIRKQIGVIFWEEDYTIAVSDANSAQSRRDKNRMIDLSEAHKVYDSSESS